MTEGQKQPQVGKAESFSKSETYPKIVVMHGTEDEFKKQLLELYIPLFVKLHDVFKTEQIFSLAHKAATDFETYWKELKTHVNINFEEEIKKYAGEEALKEIKNLTKEKEKGKRRPR